MFFAYTHKRKTCVEEKKRKLIDFTDSSSFAIALYQKNAILQGCPVFTAHFLLE